MNLSNLRRAERIRQRRRRKEKERSNVFKNPFKHAKQLLEDKRSGKLEISKAELEKHMREQYSDLSQPPQSSRSRLPPNSARLKRWFEKQE